MMPKSPHPPRTRGIVTSSRLQRRLAISGQPRKCRSLARQSRTSVKRLASQPTAMASAVRSRIGLDEGVFNGAGGDAERLLQIGKFGRDFHRGTRLAHRLEIGAWRLARAGAVASPFIEDKAGRRHQIEHRRNDAAFESWRRKLAEFRKAFFILRPQPVYDERIGPRPALRIDRGAGAAPLGGAGTKRRR